MFYETRRISLASRRQPSGYSRDEEELDTEFNTESIRKFDVEFDECEGGFPPTPSDKVLDWREFIGDING